jgi:class 3 adenylate cyclase
MQWARISANPWQPRSSSLTTTASAGRCSGVFPNGRPRRLRSVPPEHVDDLLEPTHDDLRPRGFRSVGTVMFTYFRGFEASSENRPPDLVIGTLHRYFDETSNALHDHAGTPVVYWR